MNVCGQGCVEGRDRISAVPHFLNVLNGLLPTCRFSLRLTGRLVQPLSLRRFNSNLELGRHPALTSLVFLQSHQISTHTLYSAFVLSCLIYDINQATQIIPMTQQR